jgi:hypothetical protein
MERDSYTLDTWGDNVMNNLRNVVVDFKQL